MPLQAGAQGRPIHVDEALKGLFALGLLEADQVRMDALPPEFEAEKDRVQADLIERHAGRSAVDIPGVAETRALFHRLDIDPTKTRPSSEALLRRVLQGKGLPRVNPVVDICNLCSLEHQIPLGLYDGDRVRGDVEVRLGRAGESYEGIRKGQVHLFGRLLLADREGAFGAPTADSLRTSIHPGTRRVLVVLFCPPDRAGAHMGSALERISLLLTRFSGAHIEAVRALK